MAIVNGYATLEELKERLDIPATDTQSDAALELAIEAASRMIDQHCRRIFYVISAEARYFTPYSVSEVLTGDLLSISELATDGDRDGTYETVWAASDYDLWPYNAAARGGPYRAVQRSYGAEHTFPFRARSVRITGDWGYSRGVPAEIHTATLLQAARLFKRPNAPFGVIGSNSPEVGQRRIAAVDPDVMALIAPYRDL